VLVKVVALAVAAALGLTGTLVVAGAALGPPTDCLPTTTGPVVELDEAKAANARTIVAAGQRAGVPGRGLLIALMTAAQESGLRNLDHGDRDSLGLFQQRPSAGWGSPAQVRDPVHASRAFYGGPGSPTRNPGLLDVPGWASLPLTAAAQAVQRSASPNAYAKWEPAARRWLADILDDTEHAGCQAAEPGARIAIAAAAQWLGTPYAWGGGDLDGPTRGIDHGAGTVGFDCSGLTRYAWAKAGVALPRTSRQQWHAPGTRIHHFAHLQPGDLVFFASNVQDPATIHHVALWVGDGAMLEAPRTGDVVKISRDVTGNGYWAPQFIGGLRPAPRGRPPPMTASSR
jgi:cell wall-associated NlpC family hydrolase